ncbi:hypothetical protein F4677DRAFT_435715 [Hypoxylon crocopeplum]|nr:hypothetical protein F4677DRAFT_435715 [Hypoxylon crocopeplum]
MPQGSKTAGFLMIELMYVVLGYIPLLLEEKSLLSSKDIISIPKCSFYMDDIFAIHEIVEDQWAWIED